MCGIVGTLSFNNSGYKIDKSLLVKMRDSLKHRGPDGEGYWVNNNVGIAHRRLSIIDLWYHEHQLLISNHLCVAPLIFCTSKRLFNFKLYLSYS